MTFSISNTLLVIAILIFIASAFFPFPNFEPLDLFRLGWAFVVASFLFQSKGAA
jgi:hypothetical protein